MANFEDIQVHDVVQLTNGMIVSIVGIDEIYNVFLSSSPISSLTSLCRPEHIVKVIERCESFENLIEYWQKTQYDKGNPLRIDLTEE